MRRNCKTTKGEKIIAKMLGVSVATLQETQFWDDYRMAARRIDAAMKRERNQAAWAGWEYGYYDGSDGGGSGSEMLSRRYGTRPRSRR